jgi:hypothetical protein
VPRQLLDGARVGRCHGCARSSHWTSSWADGRGLRGRGLRGPAPQTSDEWQHILKCFRKRQNGKGVAERGQEGGEDAREWRERERSFIDNEVVAGGL